MTAQRKDYLSTVEPKWCAGCGNYGVLKSLTSVFAEIGISNEKYLLVSGIGCSSRLPYYAETYGVHSIHGRAPTFALGAKLVHPELSIWIISGDGDSLSIGTNHFVHLVRRNPDIKLLLFNNMIYGLTKGQASPTSSKGSGTKTTPHGSVDLPVNALRLAHAAGASFLARATDTNPGQLREILTAASLHRGTAIVEVLVNCVIFNDGAFRDITGKESRDDRVLNLVTDQPLIFGKDQEKILHWDQRGISIINRSESQSQPLVHRLGNNQELYVNMLTSLNSHDFPVPFGVLHQEQRQVYGEAISPNAPPKEDWTVDDVQTFLFP